MKVKFINAALLMVVVVFFSALPNFAQENESVVIDEVIAQVNEGVVTLSRVKREMKNSIDSMVQEGRKQEEATAEMEKKRGELIVSLIQEELILQKGKEMSIDSEVEGRVNQRFGEIMKQQNIKTITQLYEEMRKVGINPDEMRENMRRQFTKEIVLQAQVDRKAYFGWSNKEIKDYYEKNKEKFTKPETVTLSEIFLGFAGRNPDDVRKKADQLIASLRGGADFVKTAVENSDRPEVATNKGVVGTHPVKDLNDQIIQTIKGLKAGDVNKFEIEEGIEIIRVDERINASSESVFDENSVRTAMTYEVLPAKRKEFLSTLRKEAYIKVSPTYEAMINPILTAEDTKAEVTKAKK